MIVEWLNEEKTIMYCILPEGWGIQFVHDMIKDQTELSLKNMKTYDFVINAIGINSFPKSFVSNAMSRRMDSSKDVYLRRVYVVTDSLFVKFMLRSVIQIAENMSKNFPEVKYVNTIEEALVDIER